MLQQIQYNIYNVTSVANYNSSSTSRLDSYIEMIKNSTIIIDDKTMEFDNNGSPIIHDGWG